MTREIGVPGDVRRVGLIAKRGQAAVGDVARRIDAVVRASGLEVVLDRECAGHLGRAGEGLARRAMVGRIDLVVCLGGDGTMLSVARRFAPAGVPIIGVNLGRMGFLTEVEPSEFEAFFARFLAGECIVHERMMLDAAVVGEEVRREPVSVLNDIVITKSTLARMLDFDLTLDGKYVTRYRADGLIISTPTGSTAYSLAAGGPIVVPALSAIVITPICPHALTQRPIVVPESAEVCVRLDPEHENVYLSLDGQVGHPLQQGMQVVVTRSERNTLLVRDPARRFYDVLRRKLGWGDS